MAKRFKPEEQLIENDPYRPNVNLASDLGVSRIEAFRCLVPVGADALAGEFNLFLPGVERFAQSKVGNFDFAVVENDVLWL